MQTEDIIFDLRTVYVKESVFQSFYTPNLFFNQIQIQTGMNIGIDYKQVFKNEENEFWEVLVTVVINGFNHEIQENNLYEMRSSVGGLFELSNYKEEDLEKICRIHCCNMLYPFIREEVQNRISRSGYPLFYMKPVNFSTIYKSYLENKDQEKSNNDQSQSESTES